MSPKLRDNSFRSEILDDYLQRFNEISLLQDAVALKILLFHALI